MNNELEKALISENQNLYRRVQELENWKREQISLWDAVDKHIRYHPEVNIGQSVHDVALQFLRERDELVQHKKVCFPFLKIKADHFQNRCSMLEEEIKFYKQDIDVYLSQNKFLEADRDRLASKCYLAENRNDYQNLAHQKEIKGWQNKWKIAVEMAAIAENKLDTIKNAL